MIKTLKMAHKNLQIADIEALVMGYHVDKSIWISTKDEHLHTAMQATNELDKYAVAVQT